MTRSGLLLCLLVLIAFALPAKADCVSDCDGRVYCDSQNYSACIRERGACYVDECSKRKEAFGAIAWSAANKASGYAYDHDNQRTAEREAMSECAKSAKDCKIVVSFSNGCAAVATGANKRFAVAEAESRAQAQRDALTACTKDGGGNCEVTVWTCSFP